MELGRLAEFFPSFSEGFQLESPSPKFAMEPLKSERKVRENGSVDGWNLANQLRLVVYPVIYDRIYTSQVVVWDFWTINSMNIGQVLGFTKRFVWRRNGNYQQP